MAAVQRLPITQVLICIGLLADGLGFMSPGQEFPEFVADRAAANHPEGRPEATLTTARLVTGLGLGGAMPNLIALAADLSGQRSRNASIGLSYVGMPLGAGAVSLIALALPGGEWRPLFVIGGISPIVLALLILGLLKPPASAVTAQELRPLSDLFAGGRLSKTLVMWVRLKSEHQTPSPVPMCVTEG